MEGSGCCGRGKSTATVSSEEIDENYETNLEDYLMDMTSLSSSSYGKNVSIPHYSVVDKSKVSSRPVVETVEREISPDVKQINTKIVEVHPCSGKKAVMRVSHVLNKKTGTVITVHRTDYTGGCPRIDKNLKLPKH